MLGGLVSVDAERDCNNRKGLPEALGVGRAREIVETF